MNEEINAWLNSGKDYDTGCMLYEKYGSSMSLKRLHRMSGPSKLTMQSIEYELRKLVKYAPPQAKAAPFPRPLVRQEPPKPKAPVFESTQRPNTPEAEELRQHIIGLLKVRDHLHATLDHVPQKQRAKDAKTILEVSDQIAEAYERLDHFNKHGVLPVKKTAEKKKKADEMDPVELVKSQANLRSYVSRYKTLMKKAKSPQKIEEHRQLLEMYQRQLADVEKLMEK